MIDPGLAPGTGTPEPGGWTTRELIRILRGIEYLNVVGADVVEVSPSYDGTGETTALAAAQVAFEILTSMVKRGKIGEGKVKDDGEEDSQSEGDADSDLVPTDTEQSNDEGDESMDADDDDEAYLKELEAMGNEDITVSVRPLQLILD